MRKEEILEAIRTTARENDGVPFGRKKFSDITGIREADWSGKFWARWSDAVRDAGFTPNEFQGAHDRDTKLNILARLVLRLGRFPTVAEMRLERRSDPNFPNTSSLVVEGRPALVKELIDFCRVKGEFAGCVKLLSETFADRVSEETSSLSANNSGYVYLVQSGKRYKIGITQALYRRASQIANSNAEGAELLHSFETDDPRGIEAYWHARFADKRVKGANIASGEWFSLNKADVSAFKRRKRFM